MTDFDYKTYSLQKLEDWLHDAVSTSEASPQEIYDVIKKVVREEYYYYKNGASKTYELLALLNGHGKDHLSCDKDDTSPECKQSWNNFWEDTGAVEDKVVKWVLPVQRKIEEGIDDYFVQFPDDLLDTANLKAGDVVEWVDRGDGSYLLKKVENHTSEN
jgi:hypothetical protein